MSHPSRTIGIIGTTTTAVPQKIGSTIVLCPAMNSALTASAGRALNKAASGSAQNLGFVVSAASAQVVGARIGV